ncbi:LysR family transcriptional regulator [Photobacterium galatheae]|uniref:LysR family transcriptional regulator n=1 Tax=Photobacterium galatheae TaxID=1654360 RepID=A0A066RQR6_9GAMM|nr:LysR family transcriptional regulator [Photobacterium galatheae]KDM90037.1 LysR family transcriptional regulator [Photobacterium galatheae]MCM0150015.1 LysR family transcriptional regulator [Photobacterium galatheae]
MTGLLNDMALFVEVAHVMSFRKAAEITGVPNSTLSRRISTLEKEIGLRLLHRTTRKLELTEAGKLYYERCKRIVAEAKLAHEQLGDLLEHPSGLIRASLPVDFAVTVLAPLMPEFIRRYPDITFDFDLTSRKVDMITEHFDVAIRIGEQESSTLIARKLASLKTQLYASPGYLARFGEPATPAALSQHECLHILKTGAWQISDGADTVDISVRSKFTLNNIGIIRKLATLDLGIILMPEEIVAEDLNAGRLRRLLPDWQGAPTPIYAMTETRLLPAKTRCFIEYVRECLAQT